MPTDRVSRVASWTCSARLRKESAGKQRLQDYPESQQQWVFVRTQRALPSAGSVWFLSPSFPSKSWFLQKLSGGVCWIPSSSGGSSSKLQSTKGKLSSPFHPCTPSPSWYTPPLTPPSQSPGHRGALGLDLCAMKEGISEGVYISP